MWQAGVSKANITPAIGSCLTGYLLRTKKCERIEHQLFVKSLVLQDHQGRTAAIVCLDVCGIPRDLAVRITSSIEAHCPAIQRDRIVLNCIHTHGGPAIEGYLPTLFGYSKEEREQLSSCTAHLCDSVVKCTAAALENISPVHLQCGSTSVNFGSCRRVLDESRSRWVEFGVDPAGPSDSQVPVLLISNTSAPSTPLAVLFGYACHPTATTEECTSANADYVGFACQQIESDYANSVALFIQLCGGDQNPQPRGGSRGGLDHAQQQGIALANAVGQLIRAQQTLTGVTGDLTSSFLEIALRTEPIARSQLEADAKSTSHPNSCFARRAQLALNNSLNSPSVTETLTYPISVLRFGNQFLLVALANEVVTRYGLRAKQAIAALPEHNRSPTVMIAGYCGGVSCYIPDARMQSEGGYEPCESCVYYGLASPLLRDTELQVLAGISSALLATGVRLKWPDDPITERPNSLTTTMDVASDSEFIKIVNSAERQMFDGYDHLPGINDASIALGVAGAAEVLRAVLFAPMHETTAVVIAGCGTSGRLAWQMALLLRDLVPAAAAANRIYYLMAAGDTALVVGSELAEDDMEIAAADLRSALQLPSRSYSRILYLGVTCGVSAPYVASHINLLSTLGSATKSHAILIGFNPPHLSRDVAIEGSTETFRSILMRALMRSSQPGSNFTLQCITPIIGPEPLTGSSRMKGGTATLVLLHSILACSLHAPPLEHAFISAMLKRFEQGLAAVASPKTHLEAAFYAASSALRDGHRVRYAALEPIMDGVLALVDASEMVSTFGATVDHIRAFVQDGWKNLYTRSGETAMNGFGDHYMIGLDRLGQHLQKSDLLIVVLSEQSAQLKLLWPLVELALSHAASVGLLLTHQSSNYLDTLRLSSPLSNQIRFFASIHIPQPEIAPRLPSVSALAVKSALNLISTRAFVRVGKVLNNRMIDVSVSNNKLWFRALGMISEYGKCDPETARRCLLRSIYQREDIDELFTTPLSAHITIAAQQHGGVVPRAILLARKGGSILHANRVLATEPQIAKLLA